MRGASARAIQELSGHRAPSTTQRYRRLSPVALGAAMRRDQTIAADYNRRPMRYLTAAGFGVLTGIAVAILWIVVRFVLPLAVPLFLSRIGATQSGVGGASAVIGSGSILLAALLGFVGGLVWMLWRR